MTDILIILFLILLNGVFAMSELALVSAKRTRLEKQAAEGSRGARTALKLADNPSHFLSTVQVGITVIGIFNGAFGEASLVARLRPWLESMPALAPYAYQLALGIVVACITFASIILGELVPKRIAMRYPEAMATLIAPPLRVLSTVMSPFVKVLALSTEAIARLIGIGHHKAEAPTEEDITGMIKESTDAGVFEKTEYDIVSRALRLDDRHLKALMTPRIDVAFVDLEGERSGSCGASPTTTTAAFRCAAATARRWSASSTHAICSRRRCAAARSMRSTSTPPCRTSCTCRKPSAPWRCWSCSSSTAPSWP